MKKPFTKTIASLNLVSVLIIILVLTGSFTIVFSVAHFENYSLQVDTLRSEIYQSKKAFIKNTVYRTIHDIETERAICSNYRVRPSKTSEKYQHGVYEHWCSGAQIKERIKNRIRKTKLIDDGYIWINQILNYEGGDAYAIRLVHPNLIKTEGRLLSTAMKDIKGNTPYLTELEGVKKNGELFFKYWFKKKNSEKIRYKLTFAKLYKDYNWIIATGVYLDDIETLIAAQKTKIDAVFKRQLLHIIVIGLFAFIVTFIVLLFFQRLIRKTISAYEHEVAEKEKSITDINADLEHRIKERTKAISDSKIRLRESENFLRTIYNAAENIAFVVTDFAGKDTKIIDLSPGAEKIFGYTRTEAIGKKVAIFHPSEMVDAFPEIQKKLKAGKVGYSGEALLVRKSGERFPALFTIYPRVDDNGAIIGTIGVSIDITKRKQEEDRYKKTIESSIDGFWIADTNGNFIETNQAYCQMIGYNRSELLTMSVIDIEALEKKDAVLRRIENLIKTGNDRFETQHRHKNGTIVEVEISATYSQDSEGLFFVFVRDITVAKYMEAQLKHAQKMDSIGNLAGGIAHDFNNLLFPIIGMSEMLLEDLPPDSSQHENAQEIFNAGLRAGALVKQILAFSRKSELKKIPVRIQPILREVIRLTDATIPSNIEITHDIKSNGGRILADPTQIHQITLNLITNAYHAVEEINGTISLTLREVTLEKDSLEGPSISSGNYAIISVSDNGSGIDNAILDKIFDPYFTTKEQGKGTGLGLAVVYGIIKEHNGDIRVSSTPGKGTTVNVYLPLLPESAENPSIDKSPESETGNERILLVDDEESVNRLIQIRLERLGYTVTPFTNSIEALNVFRTTPESFDLVITDMTMPNMTGDHLSTELIKIRPGIPIIICTGFSERINHENSEQIGVKGILMKPSSKSEMAQMVRNILDAFKES